MIRHPIAVALASAALAAGAWAFSDDAMPDPVLTPGAIASSSLSEICAFGYSQAHRHTSFELKDAVARTYGLTSRRGYEMDHRVPLCLGGADTAANLWPQPRSQARAKDVIEVETCKAVCRGSMPLSAAQQRFLGDWRR